jgi:hypothetical protein
MATRAAALKKRSALLSDTVGSFAPIEAFFFFNWRAFALLIGAAFRKNSRQNTTIALINQFGALSLMRRPVCTNASFHYMSTIEGRCDTAFKYSFLETKNVIQD